jgi:hypothetical protein
MMTIEIRQLKETVRESHFAFKEHEKQLINIYS